jgi:DNA-binding HxlR family transcriptional regulator
MREVLANVNMTVQVLGVPTPPPDPTYPAEIVLDALRGRWKIHIMLCIADQRVVHFGALKRAIPGISKKVLTDQLRDLGHAGILQRRPRPAARPEMLYSLTRRGQELKAVLDILQELGARWQREDASNGAEHLKAG